MVSLREEHLAATDLSERLKLQLSAAEAEERQLRRRWAEEMEMAQARASRATEECAEALQAREHLREQMRDHAREQAARLRKTWRGELEAAQAAQAEAERQGKQALSELQRELQREQRLRAQAERQRTVAQTERQGMRSEMDQLQHQLQQAESALQQSRTREARLNALPRRPLRNKHEGLPHDDHHLASSSDTAGEEIATTGISNFRPAWRLPSGVHGEEAEPRESAAKLLTVIARAQERADQRQRLRGTKEELRVRANALEELFEQDLDEAP